MFNVSQTMGRDAQQAAKRSWILVAAPLREQRGLPLQVKSLKQFSPKIQTFKRVLELICT